MAQPLLRPTAQPASKAQQRTIAWPSAIMDEEAAGEAPSRLRLIVANSEADIAAQEARRGLREALRSFTANLLRIMRGAGKPTEVAGQCVDLLEALERYRAACGRIADAAEMMEALELPRRRQFRRHLSVNMRKIFDGEQKLLRGALQVAASQLLGQSAQEAAGDSEIREGAREAMEGRVAIQPKLRWEPLASLARKEVHLTEG
jgi:hypothetical protein